MNQILSRLWIWFWHLIPANPILVRVVSGASRRPRHLWLRATYLIVLASVVLGVQWYHMVGESGSLSELAKGASQTFKWASIAQLLLMCFVAPIFTASAITQEKDAQTFNILLSTPLSAAQIVLGSLMSRLYFVILLLLAGLPIFLTTMVYGGVTTRQVIESFALSGSTAVLTGALAIFVAMVGVGTGRTIFSFYLLIAAYLVSIYLLGGWSRTWIDAAPANIDGVRMSWLTPLHPFLALDVALNRLGAPDPGRLTEYGTIARTALAYPSAVYVLWTTLLAALLVAVSMFFVRRGAKVGEATWVGTWLAKFTRSTGERTRAPRHVWKNPIAWREATTRAVGGGWIRWGVTVAGAVAALLVFVDYARGAFPPAQVPLWLAGITLAQFAIALLLATQMAATSMTKEREAKTMDLLLTTPLTSEYILWGKLRGLVSFAAPLLIGPVIALLLFGLFDLFRGQPTPVVWFEVAFELAALMVIYTAIACVIGLRRSMGSRTNMVAVMSSIAIVIGLYGAVSAIGFGIASSSSGEFSAFAVPFTPLTSIWYLVNPVELFGSSQTAMAQGASEARRAAMIGSAIAIGLYAFIVARTYAGLVRDFDMTIRKQSVQ